MNSRPLFMTGVARSGSTLLAKLLDAHPRISLASDPALPLFRSLRNAIVDHSRSAPAGAIERLPFLDYYFDSKRIAILDSVLGGSLDIACPAEIMPSLRESLESRAMHESPELVPHFREFQAGSFRNMFEYMFECISRRSNKDIAWSGLKDLWTIELYEALARAWPDARFVVIMRDPRATISSMLQGAKQDSSQLAHALSFLRHWRKYAAFLVRWRTREPAGKVHLILYEDLVSDAQSEMQRLCTFLGLPYDDSMIDPSSFKAADGTIWRGNSSYEVTLTGIGTRSVDKWLQVLDPGAVCLTELVCGRDMELFGYKPINRLDDPAVVDRAIRYQLDTASQEVSWRCDFGEPATDMGCELFRQRLLRMDGLAEESDASVIRSAFLFPEVYEALHPIAGNRSSEKWGAA